MANRAVIYARISNDRDGSEVGVTRQEELCRDLATRLGLEVVKVFLENDKSASNNSKNLARCTRKC